MAAEVLEPAAYEEEWVQVSEGFRLLWQRPPMAVVERQWQDPGTVRIFLNGCFDLMHVGHFNVLRQAKSLFYQKGYKQVVLVAGIHSDEAIAGQKGPPLFSDEERLGVLRAVKWVDEIASALPYTSMSARMADALRVHFICHGDDLPVCRGGGGMYSDAIEQDRFQLLKRTEGISTTQILERLLLRQSESGEATSSLSSALATTQRLSQFAAPPEPWRTQRLLGASERVVYVGGTFDLLHAGHAYLLAQAALLGDYLLVGLHSDETVHRQRGSPPVLTLLERAMAVLSLRGVDDVVLGAPWEVTQELLTTMNVAVVVVGRVSGPSTELAQGGAVPHPVDEDVRLAVPRSLGLVAEVGGGPAVTSEALRQRFLSRRSEFAARNEPLMRKELAYIEQRSYVLEA